MMVTQGADFKGRTALSALDLPEFFGLDDLIAAVDSARATTVEIVEFPGIYPEDGLFGIWLNTDFGDYILHAPTASELHRRQIVLHELAHMILGHELATGQTSAAALFPDLPEEAVLRTLARGHTDNTMEREAEALADLLASSMRHNKRQHSSFVRVFG